MPPAKKRQKRPTVGARGKRRAVLPGADMKWTKKRVALYLACAYALHTLLRYWLATLTSAYPVTVIDEYLYYSLARSIARGEGLVFRGQSAAYAFIVYPLVLAPVYWLFGEGQSLYRMLQLWNTALMSLSIFPLYALARAVLHDRRRAFGFALLALLLPDMMFGRSLINESIIHPMFYALIYCAYRYYEKGRLRDILLCGALGALMYFTKPGQVVPSAVVLALALLGALRKRDGRALLRALAGAACALSIIGALYLLVIYGFGYKTTLLSLYDRQMAAQSGLRLGVFAKAVAGYAYYFLLACGVIGFIVPMMRCRGFTAPLKRLYVMTLLSLAGMICGTAWVVNMSEYNSATLHMRYIAMYVPPLLLLIIAPADDDGALLRYRLERKNNLPAAAYAVLAYVLLCTALLGVGVGTDPNTSLIANLTLSLLYKQILPARETVGTALVIACVPLTYLACRRLPPPGVRRVALLSVAVLMAANSVSGYMLLANHSDHVIPQEAEVVRQTLGEREFLYVYTHEGIINYSSLDVGLKRSVCHVTMNDLFNHTYVNGGVYKPFLPVAANGTQPDRLTPDTTLFVVDLDVLSLLKLSPWATRQSTRQSTYNIISFTEGRRWVDSMIGNVKRYRLMAGEVGILAIYDPALLAAPLTIRMDIEVSAAATLTMLCNNASITLPLNVGRSWYEMTFGAPLDAFNFHADQDITLRGYELIGARN